MKWSTYYIYAIEQNWSWNLMSVSMKHIQWAHTLLKPSETATQMYNSHREYWNWQKNHSLNALNFPSAIILHFKWITYEYNNNFHEYSIPIVGTTTIFYGSNNNYFSYFVLCKEFGCYGMQNWHVMWCDNSKNKILIFWSLVVI